MYVACQLSICTVHLPIDSQQQEAATTSKHDVAGLCRIFMV